MVSFTGSGPSNGRITAVQGAGAEASRATIQERIQARRSARCS
jgi:hypothetical protein